ncbi:hypothetical protein JCM8097_000129 [Rhodosporidiobolus ruineniae]
MSPTPSGSCCVCGKETTQRCSACGNAGFDLFFCSEEHQKLVWFAHKLVCGLKSLPFVVPPLSAEESLDLCQLCDPESARQSPVAHRSVLDILSNELGCLRAEVPKRMKRLVQQHGLIPPALFGLGITGRLRSAFAIAKMEAYGITTESRTPLEDTPELDLALHTPIQQLSNFLVNFGLAFAEREPPAKNPHPFREYWLVEILHHVVIFSGVRYRLQENLGTAAFARRVRTEADDQLLASFEPIIHGVRHVICSSNDSALREALDTAATELAKTAGIFLHRRHISGQSEVPEETTDIKYYK